MSKCVRAHMRVLVAAAAATRRRFAMKKLGIIIGAALLLLLATVPAFAGDFAVKNWRVYNVMPATSKYWDIYKAQSLPGGGLQFPFQPFETLTTGSFAVYLLANYNFDLTNKIITANFAVDVTTGTTFWTRSTDCANTGVDAYVRLEFQDVAAGPYDSNDYWWSTGANSVNLSQLATYPSLGVLSISTADRSKWSNQAGKSAEDTTAPWTDWTGAIVVESPYDGFTAALKKVKEITLSFGSECRYASGVAVSDGNGNFLLTNFTVE